MMLVAWYAVLVIGVPIPMPRQAFSERFPCENCHCGCSSAEQCWNNCCCHTLEERLAWAKREGVQPPASVSKLAEKQNTAPACCVAKQPVQRPVRSCCSAKSSAKACCSSPANDKVQQDGDGTGTKSDYLVGWRALACQGTGVHWTAATPAVVVIPVGLPPILNRVEWLVSPLVFLPETLGERPPVPPPRWPLV